MCDVEELWIVYAWIRADPWFAVRRELTAERRYLTAISSTSNTSTEFGGMGPPPEAP
jgi:hypothetical protein